MKQLLAILCVFLLVACGGAPADQAPADDVQQDAQAADTESAPADDSAAEANAEAELEVEDVKEDIKTELMEYFDLDSEPEYYVLYDTQVSNQDQFSSMALYIKGTQARTDFVVKGDGQEFETRAYVTEGSVIGCTKFNGQWMCNKNEYEDPEEYRMDIREELGSLEESYEQLRVMNKRKDTVAGESVTCFMMDYEVEYEVCYTRDGIPLRFAANHEAQQFAYEATEFSRDVSNADFEPPVEVGAMPDYGTYGGYGYQ